jgi:hypothetical protein
MNAKKVSATTVVGDSESVTTVPEAGAMAPEASEPAPQVGDKVDNGMPEAKKSSGTRWVFVGISAATLIAGTTIAVVYDKKAKDESKKLPASREEFNNRHDDIGKYQKYRTAGIGIAIVGGIGLSVSLAF